MKNMIKKALNDYIRWETWWLEKGRNCESIIGAFFVGVLQGIIEAKVVYTIMVAINELFVQPIKKLIEKK